MRSTGHTGFSFRHACPPSIPRRALERRVSRYGGRRRLFTLLLVLCLSGVAHAQSGTPLPSPEVAAPPRTVSPKKTTTPPNDGPKVEKHVRPARMAPMPKIGGLPPGTQSPWGIPPELRPPNANRVLWYVQAVTTAASMSFSPTAEARDVSFALTIPLRADRMFLGTRDVTPVGGDIRDGVTGNSFKLARGGAATTSIAYGLAFPISKRETVSIEAATYASAGVDLLRRSWGSTLPYGAFIDEAKVPGYSIPGLSVQFGAATWYREGKKHRIRAVVGNYFPILFSPVEAVTRERNFIDLANLMFRPFQGNLSILAFGTTFPPDRQIVGPGRPAVRGGDVYLRSGDIEAEILSARQETHPSEPFNRWRYRQSVGGRLAMIKPTWGLGVSAWNMYGDNVQQTNFAQTNSTELRTIPGGHETLWTVDGSTRVTGGLSVFGALASSHFERGDRIYLRDNKAFVAGLNQKGWPGYNGEVRLQYQTVGPSYEGLNVRNQVFMPSNYRIWSADVRYPFKGGNAALSVRQSTQLDPSVSRGSRFAGDDPFFPSDPRNQCRGNILDWLATADFQIPKTPCHLYLSWEEIDFQRGLTAGLPLSDTHRNVSQQMAMLRIQADPRWTVDLGVIRYRSRGVVGYFAFPRLHDEQQTVPRIEVTYSPSPDLRAYLALQQFSYIDSVSFSNGLNNYSASTILMEVQSRWGGRL